MNCRLKPVIIFILSCLISSKISAYTVPFNNIPLNPNANLSAGYTFGNNAIIFCYTPDLATLGVITWPYKGVTYSGSLPMSLTNNSNATGQLADPQGTITIRNTLNSTILVSCNFAF
ncbi:MAG: hypothetical protein JO131_08860 [Gammaproteobacteria bacterium]|nr:hypothetical protein [Gammaproteobacteria bacterium]